MTVTTGAPTATSPLTEDLVDHARHRPDLVLLARQAPGDAGGDGAWSDVTAADLLAEVRAAAKGLVAAGIAPGDRVALMSRTRWEWTVLDYAIWFAGGVTVPVYETTSAEQLEWILADSGASAAIVETREHLARLSSVRSRLPDLHHVWSITDRGLHVLGRLGGDVGDDELERRRTSVEAADLATIIYTSGTTGPPKGCPLTHHHLDVELAVAVSELGAVFDAGPEEVGDDASGPGSDGEPRRPSASTLLFLPLAHVFARIVQIGCVRAGVRLAHCPDVRRLDDDLRSLAPTFVLAVPRVFEKLFNSAAQSAAADGRGRLFDAAVVTAIDYSRALDGGRVPRRLRLRHRLHSRLVYRRLRESLGGRCRWAVSGGAPLGERLGHFYRGIGLPVLEGYGLTESTAALTVNLPEAQKVGTVGRPLPGVTVRVADDGELWFRAPQVFDGYWAGPAPVGRGDDPPADDPPTDDRAERAAAATAEVLDRDGWLRSGDVGEVDDEGFVRITGRKKEILVTAGGKSVAPAVLEDALRAHPLISQCLVVGDGQPFIGALITTDPDAVAAWASARGLAEDVLPDRDPELRAEIQRAVDDANAVVSRAESIRRFTILAHDWTEEDGHLTPSLKLRRSVVLRAHRADITDLFRAPAGEPAP